MWTPQISKAGGCTVLCDSFNFSAVDYPLPYSESYKHTHETACAMKSAPTCTCRSGQSIVKVARQN